MLRFPFRRLESLHPFAPPLAWSVYIAVPVGGWGWLDGVPIGPFEAAALAFVWWTWAVRRHLPGARLLVVLSVMKIALGAPLVDRGFDASYYANDSWTPPVERSTEFFDRRSTRRDEELAFGEGRPDLPLYFYNDVKFNYYGPTQPQREYLPYSAVWQGFLHVDEDTRELAFYLTAEEAATGGLSIDGRPLIVLAGASPRTASATLERGWHALDIRVAAPQGARRRFEAGEIVDETARPFGRDRIFQAPVGPARLAFDAALRRIARLIDAALLSWLAILVLLRTASSVRDRRPGRALFVAAIVEAVRYALPYANRVTVLGGGDDMLMYEHFARVIALGDPLLAQAGPGGGQGGPFYFQPFYPYVLALTHLVFGEDLFGIIFIQRLLVAGAVAWCAAMTVRLLGPRAGWIALIGGGVFLYAKLGRWSYVLLAEPFFTPLFAGWTWLLIRLATEPPSRTRLALAGVLGGILTLIRSTLLLAWPLILPLWGVSLRTRRFRTVAILAGIMCAIVSTATLRNWIVAERFVLVTTSFGINLRLGNQPIRPLAPVPADRAAVYERLQLDDNTRGVAEYAIQAPGELATHLGRKAVYAVGLYDLSGLGVYRGMAWSYAGMWLLAAAGLWRTRRAPVPRRGPVLWLPLVLAVCHFVAVVLIFPWGYGDRLIVPLYPLLIPYAAFAVEPLVRRIEPLIRRVEPSASQVGRALASSSTSVSRRAAAHAAALLTDAAGRARPHTVAALRNRRNWAWLAYSAAVLHWLEGAELLTALILPAAMLAITRVTRDDLAHRVVGGVLWATALIRIARAGSLSAEALYDPLFWGVVAAIALGISAATGRWRSVSAAAAAVAGACTMVGMLLPMFPDFDSRFPVVDAVVLRESLTLIERQLGPLGTICLFGMLVQGIVSSGARDGWTGWMVAGARGALLAALVLTLAGAVPAAGFDAAIRLAVIGCLLGLVESKARADRAVRQSAET